MVDLIMGRAAGCLLCDNPPWRVAREEINGHVSRAVAARAATELAALCRNNPASVDLAEDLHAILDGVVRTSSAVECLDSLLRAYLT